MIMLNCERISINHLALYLPNQPFSLICEDLFWICVIIREVWQIFCSGILPLISLLAVDYVLSGHEQFILSSSFKNILWDTWENDGKERRRICE